MAAKKYIVRLTDSERAQLVALVSRGKCSALTIRRANVLLKADSDGPGWSDQQIAEAFGADHHTAENIRKKFVLEGMEAALHRKPQEKPSRQRKLDGEGEARLLATACSAPPDGRSRWTLDLLAGEMVRLNVVDSVSGQTIRRTLKKTRSSRTSKSTG